MNLSEIEARAAQEHHSILPHIDAINKSRHNHPSGTDIILDVYLIPRIIEYCDSNNIPIYYVTENCCSVAASYSQLLAFEQRR